MYEGLTPRRTCHGISRMQAGCHQPLSCSVDFGAIRNDEADVIADLADGGLLATKPYVSAAAYIKRMSNYCEGGRYRREESTGQQACPFNALYWNFLAKKRALLQNNPRLSVAYRQLDRLPSAKLSALRTRATELMDRLDEL